MKWAQRKLRWMPLLGPVCSLGCGGSAETRSDDVANTEGDDGTGGVMSNDGTGGAMSNDGTGGAMSNDGTGGAAQPSEGEPSPYDPIDPNVSIVGDGRLQEGGSVEGHQAHGWDTCYGDNLGLTLEEGGAADGEVFLLFSSVSSPTEPDDVPLGEIAFWADAPFDAGQSLFVYFEIRTWTSFESVGELSFGLSSPAGGCDPAEPVTTMAISDLKAEEEWGTRCVELIPEEEANYLLLWAEGERFAVGIDALRLGPPCR